jgi:PAS domain S-box-containing protein
MPVLDLSKSGGGESQTAERLFIGQSELAGQMRDFDWSATPLGPPEQWPPSLKTAVRVMLTSQQPIWIGWGEDLTYLYNDPYKSIIGGKHPWALGKPTSVVWREIWDEIGPMLAKAMGGDEGTYVEAQLLIMERNGYPEETYYTFSYSPIPTEDGTAGGIFCANSDDTQRVIGERQLALLRDLAASTADARTWQQVCERTARALSTDPRDLPFAMIYMVEPGTQTARLAGLSGIDAGHPAAPSSLPLDSPHAWPLAAVMRDHKPHHVTDLAAAFRATFPSWPWRQPPAQAVVLPVPPSGETGRAGFLIAGLSPVRLFDDGYAGFLNLVAGQVAAAIGNAEAYEQERRRAEALAEIDRAKTAFFSNVSHEFRTPLTLMLGPLEEVLAKPRGDVRDENRNLVEIAHRNGVRLLKLVNTLLEFSRIEAGRVHGSYEATDLSALTAELASNFQSAIDRAGLRLLVDCQPLPQPVYVDRDMWEKIVLNLLSNAFKFTFEGEIAVSVRPSADGRYAEVTVRDTGIGMSAEDLPHVFERFRRIEGARGRSFEGSGIGLALVQELVKLHGGNIRVESEPDRGSSFIVTVPFGTGHLATDRIGSGRSQVSTNVRAQAYVDEAISWLSDKATEEMPQPSSAEDLAARIPQAVARGELVLLADDNADMRQYVTRLLTTGGFRVEAVGDGEAALNAARRLKPDLIMSDVMMPKLDGFALLAALRQDNALRGVPVLLLSARAGEEEKVAGLKSGANDYLIKPFSAQELIARVQSNIQLGRARSAAEQAMAEEAEALEALHTVSVAIAAESDLERMVQVVTDAATRLSGAAFGSFFYNVINDNGESYLLYTLSGAPREAFSKFPMPRNTAVFSPTFRGEGIVRSPDITKDPRFGRNPPYNGHPKGHLPVRSYLAAPVISRSGEVLGGLFFGHPEPGIFDERAERVVTNIAAMAAIAFDKGRLYQAAQREIAERKRIEGVLRENEQSLERKVAERTAALATANARLIREAEEREHAENRFQILVAGVVDYAVFMLSPEGVITNWNKGAERIKGYAASEIIGQHFHRFYSEEDRAAGVPVRALETARREGKFEAEGWRLRKDGTRFWASVVINALRDSNGELIGFAKITRDITERREAQEALMRTQAQLAQSQKMEGIGQLTGGVAHDFNNLLTVVIGNLETIQRQVREASPDPVRLERVADLAMRGARRAEALTQRLLAFSRQQPLNPKPVEIGRLVTGMSDLLRRTIGEQIAVETVLAGGVWRTMVDPNQLEIAILNLAVNARDAMPQGGRLTIETANVYLDDRYASDQTEVTPGQYVMIAISDTGAGMTREVIARAFEPFFTTKDVGHGTGLGLSQVYGFVKQSGGHVKIYSEVGEGTTVKIYLPRLHIDETESVEEPQVPAAGVSGSETILAVEDDDDVRAYTSDTLRELGYDVLQAANGAAALRVLDEHPEIKLLFTDVGLPGGMNGRRLAEAARERRPDLKVLFTTGYARNAIVHEGRLDPGVELIPKPFTQVSLAAKLRDLLDAHAGPARVLLVEDEVLLQMLAIDSLEDRGFKVDVAGTATEAMQKLRLISSGVDAAIVDLGLPDRRGDTLVREIRTIYPALPIIIATGHDDSELRKSFSGDKRIAFVRKPYLPGDLIEGLRGLGVRET